MQFNDLRQCKHSSESDSSQRRSTEFFQHWQRLVQRFTGVLQQHSTPTLSSSSLPLSSPSLSSRLISRQSSWVNITFSTLVFGHIARLQALCHKALRCHANLMLGWSLSRKWKRPRWRWIDEIRKDDDNTPPADLWRSAIRRGHRAATLRPSQTVHWWWQHSSVKWLLPVWSP